MSSHTVLAIDDSATILKVVQLVLSKAGYAVHTALDGEEGLRLAAELRPDLILLDFVMPRMNGYQVCRALADAEGTRAIPVVLMSAKGDQVGERFVKVMGIVDYVSKPFSPEALTAVVSHTIEKFGQKFGEEVAGATGGDGAVPKRPSLDILDDIPDLPDEDLTPATDTNPHAVPRIVDPLDSGLLTRPLSGGGDDTTGRSRKPESLDTSTTDAARTAACQALRDAILEAAAGDDLLGDEVAARLRERLGDEVLARVVERLPALGRLPPEGEVLAGDLARVPIAEVLGLVDQQRQTGILTVRREVPGRAQEVAIALRGGKVEFAGSEGLGEEFLLGNFLLEREALSRQDLDSFFRSRGTSSKLCGEQLVKLNYISPDDLHGALARQTAERIYEVLRWRAGRFSLRATTELGIHATRAALQLSVDEIRMEGFRRIDEWHLIEREVDDFEMVFLRNEEALSHLGRDQLSRDELAVLELVNAKNTVRDIVRQSRLSTFEVSQMLFRLRSIRLIRRRVQPVAV